MLADLSVDGTRIVCTTEWRHKEMIKTVPGAKWDRDSMVWVTPLTWSSCLALRATFGTELEIGPGLNAWAADYRARVHDPAMALRDALEADGDPDLFPHQRADVQFLATTRRAILASQVGFLNVQVKEIKIVPVLFEGCEFIRCRAAFHRQHLHAHEFGDAAISRIDRDSGSAQTI